MPLTTTSFNPFSPEAIQDPYPVHVRLRAHGVAHVAESDTWVVSRYADVEQVLTDQENFTARNAAGGGGRMMDPDLAQVYSKGWPMARTLMTADPPDHRWYRMVLSRRFTPRNVHALEPFVEDLVNALIDEFYADGHTNVVDELALPVPLITFCSLMRVPDAELPLIKKFTNNLNDSFTFEIADFPRERELEIAQSVVDFQHYVWEMIQRRKTDLGEDVLSLLLTTEASGLGDRTLNDLEILSTVALLLNAGTETTMNLIGNGLDLLVRHPDQMEMLRNDHSLIPNMVDEVLRYESPVQCLFRNAKRDVEVGGVEVPKGARIAVLYGAANRDERQFDDPDRFDVTRADASRGLYFGKGEHFCLGAHLARLEGRVAFTAVLDRLKDLRLRPGANDLGHRLNPLSRGLTELELDWDVS